MSHNSHTIFSEVVCPLCQTVNQFETVNATTLNESERDSDFSQKEIHWVDSSLDSIHPLLYYVAVCRNCYFAIELTDSFINWQGHPSLIQKFKSIKPFHLEKLSEFNSPVKKLGEALNIEQFPNRSAIIKILLAIFDELINDDPDPLQLGRYYIRIGWLYRFIISTESEKFTKLKNKLSNIDKFYSEFNENISNTKTGFDNFSAQLKGHLNSDEITGKFNSSKELQEDKFANSLNDLISSFEQLQDDLNDFDIKFSEYKNSILGRYSNNSILDYSSDDDEFYEFLSQVKSEDDSIVLNEKEALYKAVRYFIDALDNSLKTTNHRRLQVLYLTGELSRRIDDHETAKKYFNMTISEGQKLIRENINDQPRLALPKKILELTTEQMQYCNEITVKYNTEVI